MTGLEPLAAKGGIALVKVVIERGAPAGLGVIRSWLHGQTIMVVGPTRAGKSTFVSYLRFGIFQEEDPEKDRTFKPIESPRFNLELGPNRNLEVQIKTAVDLPGSDTDQHLQVFEHRPHALVIVLDMSAPLAAPNDIRSTTIWLEDFFRKLDQRWQGKKPSRNRLRSVIVVMNKIDLASKPQVDSYEKRYRAIVKDDFRAARGTRLSDVHFRRTIMVEDPVKNPGGTKSIDAILVDMAQSLT
ncbi:MAG: hypothetical protein ACRDNF_11675, partial [Streptosporangiaceae bacterium]